MEEFHVSARLAESRKCPRGANNWHTLPRYFPMRSIHMNSTCHVNAHVMYYVHVGIFRFFPGGRSRRVTGRRHGPPERSVPLQSGRFSSGGSSAAAASASSAAAALQPRRRAASSVRRSQRRPPQTRRRGGRPVRRLRRPLLQRRLAAPAREPAAVPAAAVAAPARHVISRRAGSALHAGPARPADTFRPPVVGHVVAGIARRQPAHVHHGRLRLLRPPGPDGSARYRRRSRQRRRIVGRSSPAEPAVLHSPLTLAAGDSSLNAAAGGAAVVLRYRFPILVFRRIFIFFLIHFFYSTFSPPETFLLRLFSLDSFPIADNDNRSIYLPILPNLQGIPYFE